jgi:very-short-patch-repair endonuclease
MAPIQEVERVLREVGAAQHGVAGRSQLVARGLGPDAIDRMIRSGRLVVLHRSVYQVGPLPLARAAEAGAVLRCGPASRISHASAAALHSLPDAARPPRDVEVTMPRRRYRRISGVRIHRVRDLRPDEVTTVDGIPVTTPARTLIDIAEMPGAARMVEQAFATALRKGLVTRAEMHRMVERHPRHRGVPLLRQLLDAKEEPAFTRSQAEEKLLGIVRRAKLPRPELNAMVLGHEVDFLWRRESLIAEVDGYAFHGSPRAFAEDRRRDVELVVAGYRVLRFSWADLTDAHLATVVRLAQALAKSGG